MEVRPGYKQTEVGLIPEGWDVQRLASFVRHHNSGIYKKREHYGHGYNIVGVSDLYGTSMVSGQPFARVPLTQQERARYSLECDDLLYGESSLVREGIARTVYVTSAGAGTAFAWHTRRYAVDQRRMVSSYLYFFLQSRPARAHMIDHSIQTAITGINTMAYFGCPVIVPPLPEQEAIAEALSDADAVIDSLEQLVAKKRQLQQGAMQDLLTSKRRLPGFGGEWVANRLGDMAEIIMGQSPSSRHYNRKGDGLPLIQGNADISDRKTIKRVFTTEVTKRGRCGDILVSVRAPVGEVSRAIFDVCLGRGVCAIRHPNDFLYHALIAKEPAWAKLSKGSTFDSVNSADVKAFGVNMPTDDAEQTAIAAVLSDMDAEIAAVEAKLAKARGVKQGMMQQLLTGRIRLL